MHPSDHTVTIRYPYDERMDVYVDGRHVGTADHDNDGWVGMETVYDVVVKMTDVLGCRLEVVYGDEKYAG